MTHNKPLIRTLAAALIVGFALPALAHVGLEPAEVTAGSGVTLSFRIGHGCEGEPTETVSVQIPEGVASVRPFPKAGWDLAIETGTLPGPIETDNGTITEGVTVVTWSGGNLDDAFTDTFQIRATVYGDAGTEVYFPVVQTCADGEHAWIEIPTAGDDDLESPAPGVSLADPAGGIDTLTIAALVVGVLGFVTGCFALLRNRRSG